jgi:hypothetical protein
LLGLQAMTIPVLATCRRRINRLRLRLVFYCLRTAYRLCPWGEFKVRLGDFVFSELKRARLEERDEQ